MPVLFPLVCQTCGSNEIPYIGNGLYRCKYCRTNHIIVDGTLHKTLEQNTFFGAAAVFLETGEYSEAIQAFRKILNEAPNQSRAWWGLTICYTNKISKIDIPHKDYTEVCKYAKFAVEFANSQEREIIQKQWNQYSSKVEAYYQN